MPDAREENRCTDVVGAIRLALVGAVEDATALSMTEWLLRQAPDTHPANTKATELLIKGIRALGFSVSAVGPSGAYDDVAAAGPPEGTEQ